MIVTHTSNPSIDYFLELPHDLAPGIQRASQGYLLPGGKGLNVSMILNQLEIPSIATAFLGGFSGEYISQTMTNYPWITLQSIKIEEANRINVKIRGTCETDINAPGPLISPLAQQQMLKELARLLHAKDWLLISGSLSRCVQEDFLLKAAQLVHRVSARLVLDVPGIKASLIARLKPTLIKPNVEELNAMFGRLGTVDEQISQLLDAGVEQILLSNGSQGAFFYTRTKRYRIEHPCLKAISTVGSGDSMLAAFVGMLEQGRTIEEALVWAAAAGEATAISKGLADRAKIEALKENVRIIQEEARREQDEDNDGTN